MTPASIPLDRRYRSAMTAGAAVCLVMFVGESWIGLRIGSAALIAAAANFLERASYCSLAVASAAWATPAKARAGAAIGWAMVVIGLVALCQVALRLVNRGQPRVEPMAITAAASPRCQFLLRVQAGPASAAGGRMDRYLAFRSRRRDPQQPGHRSGGRDCDRGHRMARHRHGPDHRRRQHQGCHSHRSLLAKGVEGERRTDSCAF